MNFLLRLLHTFLMALLQLLPSPLTSNEKEIQRDGKITPSTKSKPDGDDPLTFTDIRWELSIAEDDEKIMLAKGKVRNFMENLTNILKKDLSEVSQTKDYISLLRNIKGKLLSIKNKALSDVRRFKRLRRSPTEFYEMVMRNHIHDQLLPYFGIFAAEINMNEHCHGIIESGKRRTTDKIKSTLYIREYRSRILRHL